MLTLWTSGGHSGTVELFADKNDFEVHTCWPDPTPPDLFTYAGEGIDAA